MFNGLHILMDQVVLIAANMIDTNIVLHFYFFFSGSGFIVLIG
jgi:hypothetical protein